MRGGNCAERDTVVSEQEMGSGVSSSQGKSGFTC